MAPAAAPAAKHSFLNTADLFGTQGALTEGPADPYPSTISVTGVSGTVTKVTATILGTSGGQPQDIEIGLTGPNGQTVMLVSDACVGQQTGADWLMDDDAPTFLPQVGSCGGVNDGTFKPTNYGDPDLDNFSVFPGGPAPPYVNRLSFLAGGTPNGAWGLWFVDDGDGFAVAVGGWALHLEVEPPAATPPPPEPEHKKRKKKCKRGKKKGTAKSSARCPKKKKKKKKQKKRS
jgi:hypothetical protein